MLVGQIIRPPCFLVKCPIVNQLGTAQVHPTALSWPQPRTLCTKTSRLCRSRSRIFTGSRPLWGKRPGPVEAEGVQQPSLGNCGFHPGESAKIRALASNTSLKNISVTEFVSLKITPKSIGGSGIVLGMCFPVLCFLFPVPSIFPGSLLHFGAGRCHFNNMLEFEPLSVHGIATSWCLKCSWTRARWVGLGSI